MTIISTHKLAIANSAVPEVSTGTQTARLVKPAIVDLRTLAMNVWVRITINAPLAPLGHIYCMNRESNMANADRNKFQMLNNFKTFKPKYL